MIKANDPLQYVRHYVFAGAYHTFPRKAYKRMHGAMLASTWATEDAGSEATANRKLTYSDVAFNGGGIS